MLMKIIRIILLVTMISLVLLVTMILLGLLVRVIRITLVYDDYTILRVRMLTILLLR
jgi:hypothetical protein